jgi:hypothetical protein
MIQEIDLLSLFEGLSVDESKELIERIRRAVELEVRFFKKRKAQEPKGGKDGDANEGGET